MPAIHPTDTPIVTVSATTLRTPLQTSWPDGRSQAWLSTAQPGMFPASAQITAATQQCCSVRSVTLLSKRRQLVPARHSGPEDGLWPRPHQRSPGPASLPELIRQCINGTTHLDRVVLQRQRPGRRRIRPVWTHYGVPNGDQLGDERSTDPRRTLDSRRSGHRRVLSPEGGLGYIGRSSRPSLDRGIPVIRNTLRLVHDGHQG